MTKIVVIAAVAQNGVIGDKTKNDIPWRISDDFLHFKNHTMGHPCLMGRITYESIPPNFRPLPGRENIILTSNKNYHPEETTVFSSMEKAVSYVNQNKETLAYITGGAAVYKMGLEIADVLELTRVKKIVEGDILFPEVDWKQWELVNQRDQEGIDKITGEPIAFSFLTYHRIQP